MQIFPNRDAIDLKNSNINDVSQIANIDEAAELFQKIFTSVLDKHAPVKVIQIRKNYIPYLSKETKLLMKERDKAQKLASETKLNEDWLMYKQLRNNVTNRLKVEKKNWQKSKLYLFI